LHLLQFLCFFGFFQLFLPFFTSVVALKNGELEMPDNSTENSRERVRKIFFEVYKKNDPQERSEYLDHVCGSESELRAEIESLLKAHEKSGRLLENCPFVSSVSIDESPISETPGSIIDRYKLLEKIGEGGMAVVYMAEQQEPIHRKVALKIIKLGMDTKSVIARFEAERQALAMMDHPNIAKVLDAGATKTGRPYFVMELVTGVSITEYCDKNNLSTKDRLDLFIQVCNAVQHAHQKGIIHRDIKPTNVMVAQHEGKPVPKVIDFGIAKATKQRLTEKTLFTRYAHIIGTPAYMSPEQAELSDLDVDTRSDIYSLGVLLYELLTSTTPFGEEELRKAGYLEMQRVIREQEPAKPSTKLSTLGDTLTDVAKHRNSSPDVLAKAVRGDLDWIVMKSLDKDRTRRYETANGLGLDVQRHLDSKPVLARGPNAVYRLQKFLQRNRIAAVTVLLIMIVLAVVGVILSGWNEARRLLAEAEESQHRSILFQARQQYAEVDREAALETIKPILDSKHIGPEAQLLYAGVLVEAQEPNEAIERLEKLLDEGPKIAGVAHALLARIYWESSIGGTERLTKTNEHKQKAEELLPDTAEAHYLRALTAATIKETLAYLNMTLSISPDHYESRRMRASIHYCSRNFSLAAEDALCLTVMSPKESSGYLLRGNALRELGRLQEAVDNFSKAVEHASAGDAQLVDLYDRRREVYTQMSRYQEALADAQRCVSLSSGQEVHRVHVFCALVSLGRYDEARAEYARFYKSIPWSNSEFWIRCGEYVIENLEAGQKLTLPSAPEPAFIPMLEMKEIYQSLKTKGRRVIAHGFHANWSPDGTKLVYSMGAIGISGVARYDLESQQTELLAVPGTDPVYSPDGLHIAFIRDRQVLAVDRLVTNRQRDVPPPEQREIWIMNRDGTKPRRVVSGNWPHWSPDSKHLLYQTVPDHSICSISIEQTDANSVVVLPSPGGSSRISPDGKYAAYIKEGTLNIVNLSTKATVTKWKSPIPVTINDWLPNGLLMHTSWWNSRIGDSLWIYDIERKDAFKILDGARIGAGWSPDGKKLAVAMYHPLWDIWIMDAEMLEPDQTIEEHYLEQLALQTRRFETNPEDVNSYFRRAQFHDYWGKRASANADMRRWSAVVSKGLALDSQRAPRDRRRVINMPFDFELVFSAERPVNRIPIMIVALGQKGRCKMKLFKIPMFVTSLLGFGLLSGLGTRAVQADYVFGEPTVITTTFVTAPSVSTDGRTIYVDGIDGASNWGIWANTRERPHEDWPPDENAIYSTPPNSPYSDGNPNISADDRTLFFDSKRPGYGDQDIWLTTRAKTDDPWSEPVNLGPTINGPYKDAAPSVSNDGRSLFFCSDRPAGYGGLDIYVSTRARKDDPWTEPVNLGPIVNTPSWDGRPAISRDGLTLLFDSDRPGGYGLDDIYVTTRATTDEPWGVPVNLGPIVNNYNYDSNPCISADGSVLYWWSTVGRLRQAPIIPIVDFNGDGKVDGREILIMAAHWGQADTLFDIGPCAWGDGVFDIQDVAALAPYIGKEIHDPTLVAHWPLDETEGTTTRDIISGNDVHVMGDAIWVSDDGQVGGALQLDGVDDYVITAPALDPAEGPFSVLAWIKGGAPGQVIISQVMGANYLMLDAEGRLMTELAGIGNNNNPLISEIKIDDEKWHRVGLIWGGQYRMLCVDNAIVAEDTQDGLAGSGNRLYIGADKNMMPGTHFSGMIDDVRIYNRAVRP